MKQQTMKKQSGFTLIELVIVIIILGILAATAVPKFVDMQGDARKAAMNGVKGALESAATLTYSRAALDGKEKNTADENSKLTTPYLVDGVAVTYGYPEATVSALRDVAGLSANDWDLVLDKKIVTINEKDSTSTTCQIKYTAAAKGKRPTIAIDVSKC